MRDLLDVILAAPDDNLARLVYADALQAAGDPRGEYIAVAIALSGSHGPRARRRLEHRLDELERAHRSAWTEVVSAAVHTTFRRGFIEVLDGRGEDLARVMERIFDEEPVLELRVRGGEATLLTSTFLGRVRRMAFTRIEPRVASAIIPLLRESSARALVTLRFELAGRVDPLLRTLVTEEPLPSLRNLEISSPVASSPDLFGLRDSRFFAKVTLQTEP